MTVRSATSIWNYLRVRGEYISWISLSKYSMELPPRARRIHIGASTAPSKPGTTSACAENTKRIASSGLSRRNYLRVRGEYKMPTGRPPRSLELPPRARRIRLRWLGLIRYRGTTSACAENTHVQQERGWQIRNYLRVRGEYADYSLRALH